MSREPRAQVVHEAVQVATVGLKILRSSSRWTKHEWALDGRGSVVRVDDPRARRFCLVGVILRAEHDRYGEEVRYQGAPGRGEALVRTPSPRLALVLDHLALVVHDELVDAGLQIEVVSPKEAEGMPEEERPRIHAHDLPIAFNGRRGVKHADVFRVLLTTAISLALLADGGDPGDAAARLRGEIER